MWYVGWYVWVDVLKSVWSVISVVCGRGVCICTEQYVFYVGVGVSRCTQQCVECDICFMWVWCVCTEVRVDVLNSMCFMWAWV